MSKVDLETVQQVLNEKGVEPEKARSIIAEIQKLAEEEKAEKDPATKKAKFQFVIVATEAQMNKPVSEAALYVVKVPADANHELIGPTIRAAAVSHNETKKGKKHPIKSLIDALSFLKPKAFVDDVSREDILKKKELKIQTQEPCIVVGIKNDILSID